MTHDVLRLKRADKPRVLRFVVNMFTHQTRPDRNAEMRECWERNAFDIKMGLNGRPDYAMMMSVASGEPTDIAVIANADIEFPPETLEALRWMDLGDHCLALTRYNMTPAGLELNAHPSGSQDCWIFQGHPKRVEADFTMGRPGCDNRFAYELERAGYIVRNPCLALRTIHRHASDERDYTRADQVARPYLLVPPCELVVE